jgi:hypothetical protein
MTRQEKSIFKFYIIAFILSTLLLGCFLSQAQTIPPGSPRIPLESTNRASSIVDATKAVIHHTASHDVSAETIDQWHKEMGWDGIGYHFVIRKDGTIEKGRSLSKQGAHAKGRNHWVGIVLTGYDVFTNRQIASLRALITELGIKDIEAHHENCPGLGLNLEGIK